MAVRLGLWVDEWMRDAREEEREILWWYGIGEEREEGAEESFSTCLPVCLST